MFQCVEEYGLYYPAMIQAGRPPYLMIPRIYNHHHARHLPSSSLVESKKAGADRDALLIELKEVVIRFGGLDKLKNLVSFYEKHAG